jgi:hypothetical protein
MPFFMRACLRRTFVARKNLRRHCDPERSEGEAIRQRSRIGQRHWIASSLRASQ